MKNFTLIIVYKAFSKQYIRTVIFVIVDYDVKTDISKAQTGSFLNTNVLKY